MIQKILITFIIVAFAWSVAFAQPSSEQDTFAAAKASYEQGAFGVSVDLFKKFSESFPRSKFIPEAQYFLADSYYKQDKFVEARETLVKLESTYVPYNIEAKFFYLFGQLYLKIKDTKLAAEYFNKLRDRYPHSELAIQAQVQLGRILMKEEKYAEAKDVFDKLTVTKDLAVQEEALFEKGQALFALKDYKGLLDTYEMLIKVFPDSKKLGQILFYLGEASFYCEQFDKSLAYYQRAMEKSNDEAMNVLSLLGTAWSYLKTNKPQEAQQEFSKIDEYMNVDFNKESFYFGKAMAHYQRGQFDKALENYNALLASYPQSSLVEQALFGKAQCLFDLFRFEEAVQAYSTLLQTIASRPNPESATDESTKEVVNKAHFNLIWAYIKTKKPDLALAEFQKVDIGFGDTELRISALCQIGDLYQENQQWPKAIEVYSIVLKDYPKNSYRDYCLFQLGLAYVRSSQFDFAIETFKTFNEQFGESTLLDDANYYLGYAYVQKAEYKISSAHYMNFLQVFPHSEYRDSVYYLLAVALYEQGLYREAISYFEKFKKTLGQNTEMLEKADYDIACALYQTGNEQEAVRRFSQFVEDYHQSSTAPQLLYWLGNYYFQNKQPDFARKNFEQLIRMYPQHPLVHEAWYILGVMSASAGELDGSISTLDKLNSEQLDPILKIKTLLLLGDLFAQKKAIAESNNRYNDALAVALEQYNILSSKENVPVQQAPVSAENFLFSQETATTPTIKKYIEMAYLRIGELFEKQNDFSAAIDIYQKARHYASTISDANLQFKIAECFEEKNDVASALNYYTAIDSKEEKDMHWVIKGLLRAARISEERNELQKALEFYEKIKNLKVPESKFAEEQIVAITQQLANSTKRKR